MFGISCPNASLCVAVGGNNTIASSTDPGGGLSRWNVAYAGEGADPMASNFRQIRGVSCPSPQLCVAVTFDGLVYTSTDPTGGSAAWTKTHLEGPLELRGISCTSAALCVAVGDNGDNTRPEAGDQGEIFSSGDPLAGVWQRAQTPARGNAYGVSCPSADLCVSGDLMGNLLVSTAPTSPASWRSVDGGGAVQITDVDCPGPRLCAAIDNNADVLTSTDPNGGAGAWTFTNLAPYPGVDDVSKANGTFGISCPSASLCAIAANDGQIFTSTDPFAAGPSSPRATEPGKKKRERKRPRRPRARIGAGPQPGVEIPGRKATVRFLFFAATASRFGASSASSTPAPPSAAARRRPTGSASAGTSSGCARSAGPA